MAAMLIGIGGIFISPVVSAAAGDKCGDSTLKAGENCCGGVVTSIISCEEGNSKTNLKDNGVWGLLLLFINILTAGVGIAAVGGIVIGSFMYMTAGGSPDRVKKANIFLTNVVLGIIVYAAMFAFLNFIIPGGLFSTT